MDSTLEILRRLNNQQVQYVVIGGVAVMVHESSLVTEDFDVCAPMTEENLQRITSAVRDLHPRHRMNPKFPPLPHDAARLKGFRNHYLITDLGQVDLLSEIDGVGRYEEAEQHSINVELGGEQCRVLDLPTLIRSKRAMGRPKDIHAALELEAIQQRLKERTGA